MRLIAVFVVALVHFCLTPLSVHAGHTVEGGIEVEGGFLFMGAPSGIDYSMINLKIADGAPNELLFHTGVATWVSKQDLTIIDTAKEQGFQTSGGPADLPRGGFGFPRGIHLGDLLPPEPVFPSLEFLNQNFEVTYTVVGTTDIRSGRFIPTAIPEPSTLLMTNVGLLCMLLSRRRRGLRLG